MVMNFKGSICLSIKIKRKNSHILLITCCQFTFSRLKCLLCYGSAVFEDSEIYGLIMLMHFNNTFTF